MNASFLRIIIATKLNQNCQEELILCSGEVHVQLHQKPVFVLCHRMARRALLRTV